MPVWSSPLVLRGLAAAGAVVLVAGAGYLLANNGQSTSSGQSGGTAAAPSTHRQPVHPGLQPQPANLPAGSGVRYDQNNVATTTTVVASRFDYTPANLGPEVRREVASTASVAVGSATPTHQALQGTAQFGGIRVSTLEGCLTRISASRKVLLADVARYLGTPATIIVLKPRPTGDAFTVVVVGVGCSASNGATITRTEVPVR
jgi:hypothetical protein